MDLHHVVANIKRIIKIQNVSVDEMAEALRMSVSACYMKLRGDRSFTIEDLFALADLVGTKPSLFFYELDHFSDDDLRKFAYIIASIGDTLIFRLDRNGIILHFYQPPNQFQLFLPPEQFLGRHYKEVMPEAFNTSLDYVIMKLLPTSPNTKDNIGEMDYELHYPDEVQLWHAKVVPLFQSDEITGFLLLCQEKKKFRTTS